MPTGRNYWGKYVEPNFAQVLIRSPPMSENTHNKTVATWLLVLCALVFAMVVLGGVTRLTGSGLSMVDWRPLMGWLPPLSDAEWQRVFAMYQQSPEFLKINSHMDVNDFKGIFWLEYLHRLLGRSGHVARRAARSRRPLALGGARGRSRDRRARGSGAPLRASRCQR